jgi:hypothetical protein
MSSSAEVFQIPDAKLRPVRANGPAAPETQTAEIVPLRPLQLKVLLSSAVERGPGKNGLVTAESDPEVVNIIREALSKWDIAKAGKVRSELPPSFLSESPTPRSIIICDCEAFYSFCETRKTVEVTLVARHHTRPDGFSLECDRRLADVLPHQQKSKRVAGKARAAAASAVAAALTVVLGSTLLSLVFDWKPDRHVAGKPPEIAASSHRLVSMRKSLEDKLAKLFRTKRLTIDGASRLPDSWSGFALGEYSPVFLSRYFFEDFAGRPHTDTPQIWEVDYATAGRMVALKEKLDLSLGLLATANFDNAVATDDAARRYTSFARKWTSDRPFFPSGSGYYGYPVNIGSPYDLVFATRLLRDTPIQLPSVPLMSSVREVSTVSFGQVQLGNTFSQMDGNFSRFDNETSEATSRSWFSKLQQGKFVFRLTGDTALPTNIEIPLNRPSSSPPR